MQSPFTLEAKLKEYLSSYIETYPPKVVEMRDSWYVDDLITSDENLEQVAPLKLRAIEIFHEAGSKTLEWHLSSPVLEGK